MIFDHYLLRKLSVAALAGRDGQDFIRLIPLTKQPQAEWKKVRTPNKLKASRETVAVIDQDSIRPHPIKPKK